MHISDNDCRQIAIQLNYFSHYFAKHNSSGMKKKFHSHSSTLYPPQYFSFIEDPFCRCLSPLTIKHLPFLRSIKINSIVNVTGLPIESEMQDLLAQQGIIVVRLFDAMAVSY